MYENLQLGDIGDSVKIVQEKLKMLGLYNAIINGYYGLATEVGIRAFQREVGLPETGIVNEKTWEYLRGYTEPSIVPYSVLPTLSFGSTGSNVTDLQTKLKALLYYTGSLNGNFDLETENAVKRFQYNNDLTATGTTNTQTWNTLNSLYGNLNKCVTGGTSDNYLTYTVQPGDTLYAIARRFNTTVDAIKSFNNLTSNTLSIGQVLRIPTTSSSEETGNTYIVQAGDTLYSIARRFNTTVDAIKSLNNLTSDILSIGQVLRIPTTSSNEGNYTTYTVQAGDTLYSIALRYNTTVDAIKSLNNLTSNILSIGQVLRIPTTSSNDGMYTTYVVQPGDTLYSIALRFNTTVDNIKSLNNLTSNTLSIGQVLRVRFTPNIILF